MVNFTSFHFICQQPKSPRVTEKIMDTVPSSAIKLLLFIVFSTLFVLISRKALKNPKCHGFYRFFVFEGILFLVLLNFPFWFSEIFSPRQIVSLLLLSASILFVILGLQTLRQIGGSEARDEMPENFSFENTTKLVTGGIYSYVRHPMYSSLLLLTWGVFFKHLSLVGLGVAVLASLFIVITVLIEERENIAFFGPAYLQYQKTTKMFLPFIF